MQPVIRRFTSSCRRGCIMPPAGLQPASVPYCHKTTSTSHLQVRYFGAHTGVVRGLVFKKQFGFIEPHSSSLRTDDGKDLMFTFFNLKDGRIAEVGDEVSFDVQENPVKPGRQEAVNVEGGTGRIWQARNPRAGRIFGGPETATREQGTTGNNSAEPTTATATAAEGSS
ncbi:unnamed protein product [Amoebophrya sp. A120]|nr:unnamed protein product [Amoebophrya sp. A120]|eukprot:GSA120T00020123001.1